MSEGKTASWRSRVCGERKITLLFAFKNFMKRLTSIIFLAQVFALTLPPETTRAYCLSMLSVTSPPLKEVRELA
ncbi:hypothetical protein [Capnocytophaga leadbetteri]